MNNPNWPTGKKFGELTNAQKRAVLTDASRSALQSIARIDWNAVEHEAKQPTPTAKRGCGVTWPPEEAR